MNDQAFQDWREDAKTVPLLQAAQMAGAKLKRAGSEHVGPCPICGGRDRFSVNPSKGVWNCRGAEGGHDSISLIMHAMGYDFKKACELLTGTPPPDGRSGQIDPQAAQRAAERRKQAERHRQQQEQEEAHRAAMKRHRARRYWDERVPIDDTPIERYLIKRGILHARGIPAIAAHARVYHEFERKEMPALIGCVTGPDRSFRSLKRIFVDMEGNKADAEHVKLDLGSNNGGSVWLAPQDQFNDGVWGCCEGIETGLSVRETHFGDDDKPLPVFATLSTSGLINFEVPKFVKHLSIFEDPDIPKRDAKGNWIKPGQSAAKKLSDRLRKEGVSHQIVKGSYGNDWNDILKRERTEHA